MVLDKILNDREQLILQAVVHTYIVTAEPVGSRTLVERYDLDLSSATVRHVMAELEEAGFLQQVHISSGRIPTIQGYRYYIDYLMRVRRLALAERTRIEAELSNRLNDLEAVMRQTCHLLALISRHVGMVEPPSPSAARVRTIELMPLASNRIAVLVADTFDRVHSETVAVEERLGERDLSRLRQFLNDHLRGAKVEELRSELQLVLAALHDEHHRLCEQALSLFDPFPTTWPARLYLDGAAQLFEQPEFDDMAKAREVFHLIEARDQLIELLRAAVRDGPPRPWVVIGGETDREGLEEISVVAAPYCIGDQPVGMLGVLGPRRMAYPRVAGLVDYTANLLSRFLTRLAG